MAGLSGRIIVLVIIVGLACDQPSNPKAQLPEAAQEVVTALEEQGGLFEIEDGKVIGLTLRRPWITWLRCPSWNGWI